MFKIRIGGNGLSYRVSRHNHFSVLLLILLIWRVFSDRWAEQNRNGLIDINSSIEFKLHRLQFIDLIRQGPERQLEALMYTRNFAPFASHHAKGKTIALYSNIRNYVHFIN